MEHVLTAVPVAHADEPKASPGGALPTRVHSTLELDLDIGRRAAKPASDLVEALNG